MKKICVVGTGYVGLVASAVFAHWGNTVHGVDVDVQKLEKIKSGIMPIYEKGLEELVASGIENENLFFTASLEEGIAEAEVIFICVGTPQDDDTGDADLSFVYNLAEQIGKRLDHYAVVVTKSTVPVGTNAEIRKILAANVAPGVTFDVASCPEFLAQGTSVHDMLNPSRTVIGSYSEDVINIVAEIFEHLPAKIYKMGLESAEMVKYGANTFLATKISFADQMADFADSAGGDADAVEILAAIGADPRIGPLFLRPGLGWGGSCFPKDVAALAHWAEKNSLPFPQIKGTLDTNRRVHKRFVFKIKRFFKEHLHTKLHGKHFACVGLSFKGNTDDVRESPALKVVTRLRGAGNYIRAFDPEATSNAKMEIGDVSVDYCSNPYATMEGADALIILSDWPEFKNLDLERVKSLLKYPVIFDGKNVLDLKAVEAAGFIYFAMGRPTNGRKLIRNSGVPYSAVLAGATKQPV
jgi:UDPglucose 6-dehydrogenase